MAEGGRSRDFTAEDEDVEWIQREPEKQEISKRTFITGQAGDTGGRINIVVNNANMVTSGNINITNNYGFSTKLKKTKPSKPLTTSTAILSQRNLQHICEKLGGRWKQLGRDLKLTDGELEQLELDNATNSDERNYQMLNRWVHKEGVNANKAQLAKHLAACHMGKLADYLAGN